MSYDNRLVVKRRSVDGNSRLRQARLFHQFLLLGIIILLLEHARKQSLKIIRHSALQVHFGAFEQSARFERLLGEPDRRG